MDYSFLIRQPSGKPSGQSPVGVKDYSFLTKTTPIETIKPESPEFRKVRIPLNLGGGEYMTNDNGDLYLTPRSQDSLGGTIRGKERDHIVPVSLGGTSNPQNLQYLDSKPSFWQRIGGIFGNKPTVQQSPNRQEGKLKVEQEAINKYKSGELSLGESRLMIAMENMKIQGIVPQSTTTWGNLSGGAKDALKSVFVDAPIGLTKQMAGNIGGSLDFIHRTGLQVTSGIGTLLSPSVVSISKFLGDKSLKNINYDEIWKAELDKGTKRMLDIGRPDEYFRAKITGDDYVPMMLFSDEVKELAKSSNEKMANGDVSGSFADAGKIASIKFITDWANPFYALTIRGIKYDPTKPRGTQLLKGEIKSNNTLLGKAKPQQAVMEFQTKPQNIVEVVGAKAKNIKEPNVRMWLNVGKDGTIKYDVRNLGGDIINKDLLKAVSDIPTQPGTSVVMSLPASVKASNIKPIGLPKITSAVKGTAIVKGLSPELQPLYNEAKKFKSADEFVNKIQNESNIGQSGKLQEIPLNRITGSDYPELDSALKSGKLSFDEADGFLPDNELLSKKREVIMPIEVIKNDNGTFSLQAGNHRVSQQLINGNRNILANVSNQSGNVKQQLTDIWNKANKVEPLVEEAKKYKTAEDYVKSQGELRYHQTFPENVSSIEKQGFRFDTRKSAVNDYLPVGVSTKSTPKEIGIFGKGKQLEVVIDKNSKVAQFNDRESLVKYLSDNNDEFNKAHAKIGVIDKKYNALHEELLNSNDITNLKENSSKLLNEWKIKVNKANQKAQEISTKFFKDKGVDVVQLNVDKGGFGKEIVDNTLVINPSKIKTKSQLISEWNKAQATTPTKQSIEPSFSRHYERIKEQYGFKDSVEFDRKTELAEKKKAFDFIQRSPEKALRIGYGYDEVPKGINQQVFRASLVASLNAQGKTALAQEVAKIQSSKMTEAAQTLAFGRVDIGTEAGIIKNITQARLEKIGKGLGVKEPEKRVEQARQVIERQAKDASKKVSELQKGKNTAKQLKDIDNLINSIIC